MATLLHESGLHESGIEWARSRPTEYASTEAAALEGDLKKRIAGEVRFDDGSRALYATDGSNYRQVPIGVAVPKTVDDVLLTVEQCRRFGAPLLARGGGTSLAGQCCNVAVVLDFTKYLNKLIDLDPQAKTARVQPGIVLDWLRREAESHQLTFGPDPPNRPQPVPPIFQPEVAAERIVWASHHKRREVWVGAPTMIAIEANKLAPALADQYLGRTGFDSQQTQEPAPKDRPDNLFEPVPGDFGAHGVFGQQAHTEVATTWFAQHKGTTALAGAALGLLAFAVKKRAS